MACCAFHGRISEIPDISVDNFTNKDVHAYFLSHTHTDHTQGLYDPRFIQTLEKNGALLYMSEMSAAIVKYEVKCRLREYDTEEIIKRIRIMKLESISVELPEEPRRRHNRLWVTAVPAAHSFGSVMFLFRVGGTTVLYTGDFRISVNDVCKFNQLHDNRQPIPIDALYVDTTFLDDRYTTFPKRSVSVEAVLSEIKSWLGAGGKVAIKTSAKFGYEFLFNKLHEELGVKVYVEAVRWRELYSQLPHLVPGVTNDNSPIHLCWPKNRKDHTKCTPDSAHAKYLNIHLSAQKWTNYQSDDEPIAKVTDDDIDVCFSTHCSRSELLYFVSYFSPKRVVGFPNEFCYRQKIEGSLPKKIEGSLPKKIEGSLPKKKRLEDKKMDKSVLSKIFDIKM